MTVKIVKPHFVADSFTFTFLRGKAAWTLLQPTSSLSPLTFGGAVAENSLSLWFLLSLSLPLAWARPFIRGAVPSGKAVDITTSRAFLHWKSVVRISFEKTGTEFVPWKIVFGSIPSWSCCWKIDWKIDSHKWCRLLFCKVHTSLYFHFYLNCTFI